MELMVLGGFDLGSLPVCGFVSVLNFRLGCRIWCFSA